MENDKNFSIYTCLLDVIKIYNENILSSKNFRPMKYSIQQIRILLNKLLLILKNLNVNTRKQQKVLKLIQNVYYVKIIYKR